MPAATSFNLKRVITEKKYLFDECFFHRHLVSSVSTMRKDAHNIVTNQTMSDSSSSGTQADVASDYTVINVNELRPIISVEVPLLSKSNNPHTFLKLMGGEEKVLRSLQEKSSSL